MRGVVQIDAEIVGQHELDPAHHVLRARQLAQVDEAAAGGDGAPVDPARVERAGLLAPVGEDLEIFPGDDARSAGGGVAGALADQVGRQVPIGIERGIADQARHFRRRHGALADDDAHRVADPPVLDHPEPGGGGVDEDVAALHRRNGARALDIGEDQALVISRAPVERGDGGGIGAAGDGQPVHLLEQAQGGGGIGVGGETEPLTELLGPAGGDLELGEARPAGAIGAEAADEAVIGRVAGEGGAGERGGRGRGGERVEQVALRRHGRGEAGVDIAHGVALRGAGAVAGRVEESLAQHHVGAQAGAAVARADCVERGHDVRTGREPIEQGLVRAVGPDRLEIALRIEGEELRARFEGSGRGRTRQGRARGRGLGRVAVGRDGPEADGEAGGAQEAGQIRHCRENRRRRRRGPTTGGAGRALCRTDAGRRDSLSFAARRDMGTR